MKTMLTLKQNSMNKAYSTNMLSFVCPDFDAITIGFLGQESYADHREWDKGRLRI